MVLQPKLSHLINRAIISNQSVVICLNRLPKTLNKDRSYERWRMKDYVSYMVKFLQISAIGLLI